MIRRAARRDERHQFTFDTEQNEFVVAPEKLNLIEELQGNTEYEQPN